jgi:hypothetical protein
LDFSQCSVILNKIIRQKKAKYCLCLTERYKTKKSGRVHVQIHVILPYE